MTAPEPTRRFGPDAAALAGLLALCGLVFGLCVAGYLPLVRDIPGFTFPSRFLWRQAALDGRLFEWNPYVQLGVPILGTPVHGGLYPGHLPLLVGSPATGFGLTWLLHAWIGAAGGYALGRSLGCRPTAAFIAGAVWAAGGYAVSMWWNGEKVLSGAWVPWVAAALCRAAAGDRVLSPWVVGASAALALTAFAGDPFLWFHAMVLAAPLAWARARDLGASPRAAAMRTGTQALLAVGVALLLSGASLVPALTLRGETERAAAYAGELAARWSLHPVRLLEWVAPGALGNPLSLEAYPGRDFALRPELQSLPWAVSVYSGTAALAFAVAAGRRRVAWASWGVLGFGLFAALGRHTPFESALRALVPPLQLMRYPEKHALLCAGALSVLSALGAERLLDGRARLRLPALFWAAAAGAAALLAPAALERTTLVGLAHGTAALVLLCLAVFVARRQPRAAPLVAGVVALDLAAAAWPDLRWVSEDAAMTAARPVVDRIAAAGGRAPPRLFRPRVSHLSLASLPDQYASVFGIGAYPGHDPAKNARLTALCGDLALPRLLSYLQIDWALLPPEEPASLPRAAAARDGWQLYRVGQSPRAWRVARAVTASDADAARRIGEGKVALRSEVLLPPGAGETGSGQPEPGAACAVSSYEAQRVEVRCPEGPAGWLVLADGWAPGWSATVDGEAASVERADVALRAVRLPAGAHAVVMRYDTPGLGVGVGLTVLGVLACGVVLAYERRRRG